MVSLVYKKVLKGNCQFKKNHLNSNQKIGKKPDYKSLGYISSG